MTVGSRRNAGERFLAFAAALTSILCLLIELYGGPRMSVTVPALLLPGTAVVLVLARRGSTALRSDIRAGTWSGFLAACAYDVFRIPFVVFAGMPLFKVFPAFGTSITSMPPETAVAQAVGWLYHFSNGMSFGIMYVILFGRRRWFLGVPFALGIETGLLLSPYASFFGIEPNARFILVTVLAHGIFGLVLGLLARWSEPKADPSPPADDQRMTTPA